MRRLSRSEPLNAPLPSTPPKCGAKSNSRWCGPRARGDDRAATTRIALTVRFGLFFVCCTHATLHARYQLLCRRGADVQVEDTTGTTALMIAASERAVKQNNNRAWVIFFDSVGFAARITVRPACGPAVRAGKPAKST